MRIDVVDPGVDPRGKMLANALRTSGTSGIVGRPFHRHVTAIQKQPRGRVLLDVGGAENFGQQPQPASPPEVHLEQPVTRRIEALREKRVIFVLRKDVRDAGAVDKNFYRRIESRKAVNGFVLHGEGKSTYLPPARASVGEPTT